MKLTESCLVLIIGFLTSIAEATDFYVSVDGDDRQSGGREQPFRTVSRGISMARNPGDSVIVREGIYRPKQSLNLGSAGEEGKLITLRAETGESVIIDGTDCPKDANLIAVLNHHIRVEGLTVRNSKNIGIVSWGPGSRVHHIEIVNNTVHHTHAAGIFAGCPSIEDPVRDILMEGNTVHHSSMLNEDRSGKNGSWGFAVGAGLSKNVVLRNNVTFHNYGEAIALYLSDFGLIEGNTAYDNFAVNYYLDNVTNTTVTRNMAYSTGNPDFFRFGKPTNGIQIANERYGVSNPGSHNTITHNLLINNGSGFCYGAYQNGGGLRHTLIAHNTVYGSAGPLLMIDGDAHRESRIVNNIFVFSNPKWPHVPEPRDGLLFSHNLWFGVNVPEHVRGRGDVYADPQFVDPSSGTPKGFALKENSPARGAGEKQSDLGAYPVR